MPDERLNERIGASPNRLVVINISGSVDKYIATSHMGSMCKWTMRRWGNGSGGGGGGLKKTTNERISL